MESDINHYVNQENAIFAMFWRFSDAANGFVHFPGKNAEHPLIPLHLRNFSEFDRPQLVVVRSISEEKAHAETS